MREESLHVSVLYYADDIAILSETDDGMKIMLDELNEWCAKWRITINESKTKVLHFRTKSRNVTKFHFKCGDKTVEVDSS